MNLQKSIGRSRNPGTGSRPKSTFENEELETPVTECGCGATIQFMPHLLAYSLCPTTCPQDNLYKPTDIAVQVQKTSL